MPTLLMAELSQNVKCYVDDIKDDKDDVDDDDDIDGYDGNDAGDVFERRRRRLPSQMSVITRKFSFLKLQRERKKMMIIETILSFFVRAEIFFFAP